MKTLLLLILFLLPALADASCGVGGTAKVADGRIVTKTAAEAALLRIGDDGYWWTCNAQPMLLQPPADCAPAVQGFRTWTVGQHTCTTADRYQTSATSPARDRVIKHGRTDIWQQWRGPMRGQLIERCTDGVRVVTGATCAPVSHCDTRWSYSSDGGRTVYSYDARHHTKRVPVGEYVEAATADGKAMRIKCISGEFQRAR